MDHGAARTDRLEPLRRIARRVPGAMTLGRALHRLADPALREVHRLQSAEAERLFQPFPDTLLERYPALFDALAEQLSPLPKPRILSFGCSSGAEVRALRRRVPHARIVGLDLNRRAIEAARNADPAGDYRIAAAPDSGEHFDAILAMAVFRHGELEARQPESCAAILPFARFAAGIAMLDGCLEPGGWLAIYHAHYRFCDTPTFAHYRADPLIMPGFAPQTLLYGPDDTRLDGSTESRVLFRKVAKA